MRPKAPGAVAAAVLLAAGAATAQASAGLSCEAHDKSVKLVIEAGISRGVGDDIFSFRGELEILATGVPKDFQQVSFDKDNLTQRWLDSRNLKLRLYRERSGEPHGSIDIVIEAWPRKGAEDIEFRGGYVLTVFDIPKPGADGKTLILKGRVTCSTG